MYTKLLTKDFVPQMATLENPCYIHVVKKGSNYLEAYFGDRHSFMLKESNENFPYSDMCLCIPVKDGLSTFRDLEQLFTSRKFLEVSKDRAPYRMLKSILDDGSVKFASRLWIQFTQESLKEVVNGLLAIDAKTATFSLEGFSCTVKGISRDVHEFEYEFATKDLELDLKSNLKEFVVATSSLAFLTSLNSYVNDSVLLEFGYCKDLGGGTTIAVVRNLDPGVSMAVICYEEPK